MYPESMGATLLLGHHQIEKKNQFFLSSLRTLVWKVERKEEEKRAVEFVHLVLDL